MVAALYVDVERGPYPALGLDCWGEDRDARLYPGPGPVIAHPPCGPWGALKGLCRLQDRSLGPVAVEQVRMWGGVLEHPAHSSLWAYCKMPQPGGFPDVHGGWTLAVDQCWWGHPARKQTWLYFVGILPERVILPTERPGPVAVIDSRRRGVVHVPKSQRHLTPPAFARWLVEVLDEQNSLD